MFFAPGGQAKSRKKRLFTPKVEKSEILFPRRASPKSKKGFFTPKVKQSEILFPRRASPKSKKGLFTPEVNKYEFFVPRRASPKSKKGFFKPHSLKFSGQVKENTRGEGTLSFLVVNSVFGNRGALFLISFPDVII